MRQKVEGEAAELLGAARVRDIYRQNGALRWRETNATVRRDGLFYKALIKVIKPKE